MLDAEEINQQSFHISGPPQVGFELAEGPLQSSHSRANIQIDESGQAFISTLKTTQKKLSIGSDSVKNMLNVPSTMIIDSSKAHFSPSDKKPFKPPQWPNEVMVIDEVERVNQSAA